MALFPSSALERAMQIKEVLMRAMNKEYSWLQAADILGITPRGLRRLRKRMEEFGYQGLVDMRRGRPSPRRTPVAEVERILEFYRERYSGFNAKHFFDMVRLRHGVTLSYGCVKQILQGAGLVKRYRSRGRHRRRRERKASFGEMLHIDGSPHEWLDLVPGEKQTLIQVLDDATSRLLYAQLWPGETKEAILTAIKMVVAIFGIAASLYSDRAGWAFETPKAGGKVDKLHLTAVGEVLKRLGIEHIPSYSPQARGRSERLNRTLQDRLVAELKAADITTIEAANQYINEHYIPMHDECLAVEPKDAESAFVSAEGVDFDEVFYEAETRKVGKDNTVSADGLRLQISKQPGRRTCSGLSVELRRHLNGTYSIRRGTLSFGRYDATGTPIEAKPLATRSGRPMEAAGPVEDRQRQRSSTRPLDAGKRRRRPQLPQAPAKENVKV